MSATNNGGPAFPVNYSNEADGPTVMPSEGMSVRDYAAIKAMQAMITCGDMHNGVPDDAIAQVSYRMADAMIKAREAK